MAARIAKYRLKALGITLLLAALAAWLLPFGFEQRHLFYKDYRVAPEAARSLSRHPDILYAYGRRAEAGFDIAGAIDYYTRAVAANPLHMSAWLRLADMSAIAGNPDRARRITAFCDEYIAPVMRWKWPHALLAHHLGMEDIFSANINFLIAGGKKVNDALNLLDTHSEGEPAVALSILDPENRPAYLKWAIRWKRMEAAQTAWKAVSSSRSTDDEMLFSYVHFLIGNNRIPEAATVWGAYSGHEGITNGGFEAEITRKGFDWRVGRDHTDHWRVRRDIGQGRDETTALRVDFDGGVNVDFHHVYQVVAVKPDTPYRLTFWWRSKGMSTDQVPFVEIYGYKTKGLYIRGRALEGASDWRLAQIAFTSPADCDAVVVRVRRKPSQRFDNKIRGSLWLDDFELLDRALTAES